jgi:hypothetical protein
MEVSGQLHAPVVDKILESKNVCTHGHNTSLPLFRKEFTDAVEAYIRETGSENAT